MALSNEDLQAIAALIQPIKEDIQGMKADIQDLQRKVTGISLHLENHTDRNIQLLAENFIELTNKLNQAIPAANKNLAYEVKVSYLIEEVDKLKEEVSKIKNQTA